MACFHIITGTMGGGKSYMAAEICYTIAKEGGVVCTNIDLVEEHWRELGLWDQIVKLPAEPEKWREVIVAGREGAENGLVVDEAAVNFHVHDAKAQQKQLKDLFQLLVWSRKLGLEVYFISQSLENLDAALRRMAGRVIRCVAVKEIPFVGLWWAKATGYAFKRIALAPNGRMSYGSTWHRFDKSVAALYKTDAMSGHEFRLQKQVGRKKASLRSDQFIGLLAMVAFVFVVVTIIVSVRTFYFQMRSGGAGNLATTQPKKKEAPSRPSPAPASPASSGQSVNGQPPQAAPSPTVKPDDDKPDVVALYAVRSGEKLELWTAQGVLSTGAPLGDGFVKSIAARGEWFEITLRDGRRIMAQASRKQHMEKRESWNTSGILSAGGLPASSSGRPSERPSQR